MSSALNDLLHRYTSLPSALDLLLEQRLFLGSPSRWADRNDSIFLEEYRKRKSAKAVFAVCLTEAEETSHHWTAFASGTDGVRIEFDKRSFLEAVSSCDQVSCR